MKPHPEAVDAHSDIASRTTFIPHLRDKNGKVTLWLRAPAWIFSTTAVAAALAAATGINFQAVD